jgi:hypothetical protein
LNHRLDHHFNYWFIPNGTATREYKYLIAVLRKMGMKFNKETISTLGGIKLKGGDVPTGPHFDIALPADYIEFVIKFHRVTFSDSDILAFQFSLDGDNFVTAGDAYVVVLDGNEGEIEAGNGIDAVTVRPVVCGITGSSGNIPNNVTVAFDPGSDSFVPTGIITTGGFTTSGIFSYGDAWFTLNPDAASPPTPARATTLRVTTLNGRDITGGSWVLFGEPA